RVGEVAKLFVEAGTIVLCSFISPFRAERQMVRELFGPEEFVEVFVQTPLEDCIQRDPKGLYVKALEGKIDNFTGVSSPYEEPDDAEVVIKTRELSAADAAKVIVEDLVRRGRL
ncbi:MAG TPA: adenylyl-sulfate kinase, partial [Caulobacteraceae bacterium]|nr:adenylyl-sulfate kinase [Caulobacteraceae bacterium]